MATRFKNMSTGGNLETLLAYIKDPTYVAVSLFATDTLIESGYSEKLDGPANNLPLMAALTEHQSGDFTVFDGLFLTAARRPRYLEVRELLDFAQDNPKVSVCATCAPFTSAMTADEAAQTLLQLGPTSLLTAANRHRFFSLLSPNLTEQQYF